MIILVIAQISDEGMILKKNEVYEIKVVVTGRAYSSKLLYSSL